MWTKPSDFTKTKKFSISKNYFEYSNFDSVREIINVIKDNKGTNVNYNELLCKDDPVKPYFDIESTQQFDIFNVIETIKNVFKNQYLINLSDDQIFILECKRIVKEQFKWSYHVIIDGYHFDNKKQAKFSAIDINELHPEVDLSVYSDGYQNIRMLNCVKKDETVPFTLVNKQFSEEIFAKCLITNILQDSIAIEFTDVETIEVTEYFNENLSKEEFLDIIPLIEKDLGTNIINVQERKNYITFNYDHSFQCLFGGEHTQLGHCVNKLENGVFIVTCFSGKCNDKKRYTNNNKIMRKAFEHIYGKDGGNLTGDTKYNKGKNVLSDQIMNSARFKDLSEFQLVCKKDEIKTQIMRNNKISNILHIDDKDLSQEIINMYNFFINDNENRDNLSIVIDKSKQLQIHDNSEINDLLYTGLKQRDTSIKKILFLLYKDFYKYSNGKWYFYNGIYYEIEEEPLELITGIEQIANFYSDMYELHSNKDNLNEVNLKLIEKITKNMEKKLSSFNTDVNISKWARVEFTDKKFADSLDLNNNLIAFNNGVFDLSTFDFRNHNQQDRISKCLDYDYYEQIDTEKRNFVIKFMEDILPDKDEREYLLKAIGSALLCKNNEQEMYILTGKKGSNGKSLLVRLINACFGIYTSNIEPTLLTNKREKSNESNESLADTINKKIVITSEPNSKDRIQSDVIKKLTGGDMLTVRGLYEKTKSYTVYYKIFMLCNSIPLLDKCDSAEQRRLSIIKFPIQFVNKPTKKFQKQIDITLPDKLLECKVEFVRLIFEYTKLYLKEGLNKPKTVLDNIANYIGRNVDDNEIIKFIEETIEEDNSTHPQGITRSEAWELYRNWCSENGKKQVKQRELDEEIENLFDLQGKVRLQTNGRNSQGWKELKFIEAL